ncbi:hypothetical protein [Evansella cellulosilytica]|uniref:hypothetical protein n=1 Tax=Evansella cellulosilytica TaxID=1413 RepID=UPI0002DBA283|nr:hypothetical protein [Evansella cellulosilytica]
MNKKAIQFFNTLVSLFIIGLSWFYTWAYIGYTLQFYLWIFLIPLVVVIIYIMSYIVIERFEESRLLFSIIGIQCVLFFLIIFFAYNNLWNTILAK